MRTQFVSDLTRNLACCINDKIVVCSQLNSILYTCILRWINSAYWAYRRIALGKFPCVLVLELWLDFSLLAYKNIIRLVWLVCLPFLMRGDWRVVIYLLLILLLLFYSSWWKALLIIWIEILSVFDRWRC